MQIANTLINRKVIIFMLSILPIIDSINGVLVRYIGNGFSYIYKLILILILYLIIITTIWSKKTIEKYHRWYILIITYICCSMIWNTYIEGAFSSSLIYGIKLIYNITLIAAINYLLNNKILSNKDIEKIFNTNIVLFLFVILLPQICGIGYSQYSNGIGYKGFYYSNNEFNTILTILFLYQVIQFLNTENKKALIKLVCLLLILLIQGSKSSMATILVGVILFTFNYYVKYKEIINVKYILIAGTILTSTSLLVITSSEFMERQKFLFNIYSGNILSVITSGRDVFVIEATDGLLWGQYPLLRTWIGNGFHLTKLVEMDFIDIFFSLGIIGLITSMVISYMLLKNVFIKCAKVYLIFLMVLIINSFMAGHILFMSTASPYWIMLVIYCYNYQENDNAEIKKINTKSDY